MIGGPMIGALSDRFGHWRVLFAGAILEVALWPLPAFAWSIASLGIAWAFLNSFLAGVFSVSFAVLSLTVPKEARGRVMSYAYLPLSVGLVLGPLVRGGGISSLAAGIAPGRIELPTSGLGNRCSIQLSYGAEWRF